MEAQFTIEPKMNQDFQLKPVRDTSALEINSSIHPIPGTLQIQSKSIQTHSNFPPKPFIEANTQEIGLHSLTNDCVIPVFSKDNERTIAHQEFIEIAQECISKAFPNQSLSLPEIRVSHQIKGRTPEAIHKNAKDLLDSERTQYFERMAFIVRVPGIQESINGNELALTIGGVRSYNQENLYNKKSMERFKFFIGFQNKVCCNLCIWSDGLVDDMRVASYQELQSKISSVIYNYEAEKHLDQMRILTEQSLTEKQFAQLVGRARMYQHLPKAEKSLIPCLSFTDGHLNTIVKDYYEDGYFSRTDTGDVNLWSVYNLFTQANKSSYIDTFLDRNVNAFDFTRGIQKALIGNEDCHWFLS